jgi:hypothetical protein
MLSRMVGFKRSIASGSKVADASHDATVCYFAFTPSALPSTICQNSSQFSPLNRIICTFSMRKNP